MGDPDSWERAERALADALDAKGMPYDINPGEGAFYGPKIEFHVTDAIGRTWQCGTIQVDFSMPERFDLEYTGRDGARHRPVMIHRAILGSFERLIGVLIEHHAGKFPPWLAPVQVVVMNITDGQAEWYRSRFVRDDVERLKAQRLGRTHHRADVARVDEDSGGFRKTVPVTSVTTAVMRKASPGSITTAKPPAR